MPKSQLPQGVQERKPRGWRYRAPKPTAFEQRASRPTKWELVEEHGIVIGRVIEARSEYSHEGNRTYPITLSAGLRPEAR